MKKEYYPVFPSSLFKWDKETFVLSTVHTKVPGFLSWVSEDEMIVGFAIRSTKTGSVRKFKIVDIDRDPDGEIHYWYFEPMYTEGNPELEKLKVVVFNDRSNC